MTDEAGQTFRGQCAELCGAGHRLMLFEVHAMTGRRLRRVAGRQDRRGPATAAGLRPPASGQPSAPAESGAPPERRAGRRARPSGRRPERVAFETPTLTAPANSPITIEFDNQDALPHSVKIFKDRPGAQVVQGRDLHGSGQEVLPGRPARGRAPTLLCAVHPNMTGTLTVK